MNIPQEELNKLNESALEGTFDEHAEEEEPMISDSKVEEKVSGSTTEESVADKARIPYSRFEKVNERAIRAEERLSLLEEQLNANKQAQSNQDEITPDPEFIELYGDSDAAKRAYSLQLKREEKMLQQATERAMEEIDKRQTERQSEVEKNLEYIEDNLAKFQDSLGRELSDAEESAILDIQDEFTPKDEKGNYIAPFLSPEKAFEVYNLRQASPKAEKSQARKRVVSVTGANSEGGGSAASDYRPGVSGQWRNSL